MTRLSIPADTTVEAARVQAMVFRQMPAGRRLELAFEMSNSLRRIVAAGVRNRHPEYSPEQVRLAVIRLTLGEDLFRQAFPGVDVKG
jgi:hypothetical protein